MSEEVQGILFFALLVAGLMYMNETTNISITVCPTEDNKGYAFVGLTSDYKELSESLPNLSNLECEERTKTKGEWYDIKVRLRETYPGLQRPRGVR